VAPGPPRHARHHRDGIPRLAATLQANASFRSHRAPGRSPRNPDRIVRPGRSKIADTRNDTRWTRLDLGAVVVHHAYLITVYPHGGKTSSLQLARSWCANTARPSRQSLTRCHSLAVTHSLSLLAVTTRCHYSLFLKPFYYHGAETRASPCRLTFSASAGKRRTNLAAAFDDLDPCIGVPATGYGIQDHMDPQC
jgi:hypothetical protein